jgi:hypothetical protein
MEFTFYSPHDIARRVDDEMFVDAVLKIRACVKTAEVRIPYKYWGKIDKFRADLNSEVADGVSIVSVDNFHQIAIVEKLRGG